MTQDDEAYREFVTGRIEGWRRTAYLLCGDWHAADDTVQNMLLRLGARPPRRTIQRRTRGGS